VKNKQTISEPTNARDYFSEEEFTLGRDRVC